MPKAVENKIAARGGKERVRMAHPKGRPDLNIPVAITKKSGPRGGKTVALVSAPTPRKPTSDRSVGSWGAAGRETGNCPGIGKSKMSTYKHGEMKDEGNNAA